MSWRVPLFWLEVADGSEVADLEVAELEVADFEVPGLAFDGLEFDGLEFAGFEFADAPLSLVAPKTRLTSDIGSNKQIATSALEPSRFATLKLCPFCPRRIVVNV